MYQVGTLNYHTENFGARTFAARSARKLYTRWLSNAAPCRSLVWQIEATMRRDIPPSARCG